MIAKLHILGFLIPLYSLLPFADCERWHAEEVNTRPDWVDSTGGRVGFVVDTVTSGEYFFDCRGTCARGKVIVKSTANHELFNWEHNGESDFEDSLYHEELLMVSGADTTVLDGCHYGYDHISFSPDGSTFAVFKIHSVGEEHCQGNVVLYDSTNPDGLTIFALASCSLISFSPDGYLVAFSDLGDLYISSVEYPAAERVLHEGGSYWLGGCMDYSFVTESLEWSTDGTMLYYEYSFGFSARTHKQFLIK